MQRALVMVGVVACFIAAIYRMYDDRWVREAEASVDAVAVSAERLGAYYYVGLGCVRGACTANAGQLVRIPAGR